MSQGFTTGRVDGRSFHTDKANFAQGIVTGWCPDELRSFTATNTTFIDCHFKGVKPRNSYLRCVQFMRCSLDDVDFTGSLFQDVRFDDDCRIADLRVDRVEGSQVVGLKREGSILSAESARFRL
jgi:uncharacterized protein YjbI with pentapeptide repeats